MTEQNHVGCLVPIRLASERLPGKALMEICGKPIAHHLLDRIFSCKNIKDKKDVVVCTTKDASDDALVDAVEGYGASVFRGSTDDIIERFYETVQAFDFDIILQVDGDDPLCDPEYMDLCIAKLQDNPDIDVVTCAGLPLGIASKAFTRRSMDVVYRSYKTSQNDTGFAYYFTKSGMFKQAEIVPLSEEHIHDTARLTLDYDVDFQFFKAVIEGLYQPDHVFGLADVVAFLRAHPDVAEINSGLDEEYYRRTEEKAVLDFVDERGECKRINL